MIEYNKQEKIIFFTVLGSGLLYDNVIRKKKSLSLPSLLVYSIMGLGIAKLPQLLSKNV